MTPRTLALCVALGALAAGWGCGSWMHEGLDVASLPPPVQPDYLLFANRCSKCHSLARPLTSGIDEDAYWVDYVDRMRRQPASGISLEDTVGILRFLHYFSIEEKRKSGKLPPETGALFAAPLPAVVVTPSVIVVEPPPPSPPPAPAPPPPPASSATARPAEPERR